MIAENYKLTIIEMKFRAHAYTIGGGDLGPSVDVLFDNGEKINMSVEKANELRVGSEVTLEKRLFKDTKTNTFNIVPRDGGAGICLEDGTYKIEGEITFKDGEIAYMDRCSFKRCLHTNGAEYFNGDDE